MLKVSKGSMVVFFFLMRHIIGKDTVTENKAKNCRYLTKILLRKIIRKKMLPSSTWHKDNLIYQVFRGAVIRLNIKTVHINVNFIM